MIASTKVFTGPMFSGKSRALVSEILKSQYARERVLTVKPMKDIRNPNCIIERGIGEDGKDIIVHRLPAVSIADPWAIMSYLEREQPHLLAIDEVHLFEPEIKDVLDALRNHNRPSCPETLPDLHIAIAGLDMDHRRQPFDITMYCMGIADAPNGVEKFCGVCMKCGNKNAAYTQALRMLISSQEVGSRELYEIRCRACHTIL
jgi:thymidine kinase